MVKTAFQPEDAPLYFQISDPPYENYFYADDVVSCQVILASPLPLTQENANPVHRLLFAWPGGNSGAAVFFEEFPKENNKPLSIKLLEGRYGRKLDPVTIAPDSTSLSEIPSVGVSGLLEFSDEATLNLAILGSVRTLRDYTEGHGILNPKVQERVEISEQAGGIDIKRVWFDGRTTIHLNFSPSTNNMRNENRKIALLTDESGKKVTFTSGVYSFQAHIDYPQPSCMHHKHLLKPSIRHLISHNPDAVNALSFLSTPAKLLTGAWRFLTYFGRDTLISILLLGDILSDGEHGTIEAGLSAVLERISWEDGSVCHEENLGDYPAAQAALAGSSHPEAEYDYKMIDTDFFLPILMEWYLVKSPVGQERLSDFLRTPATLIPSNRGRTYRSLLERTCEKILKLAKPLSDPGGDSTHENLIALKADQPVGQWRDSDHGLGGGRYPYDVNTALMPAALHSIVQLARAGAFDNRSDWEHEARQRAEVWQTSSLKFFTVRSPPTKNPLKPQSQALTPTQTQIPPQEANHRLQTYVSTTAFPGPVSPFPHTSPLHLQALALTAAGAPVEIMHTDTAFRLLLLPHLILSPDHPTAQAHHTALLSLLTSLLTTFPTGLFTPCGVLVANPAYSTNPQHHKTFARGDYHGTVVWGWNSLGLVVRGLEAQLDALNTTSGSGGEGGEGSEGGEKTEPPALGENALKDVRQKLRQAYAKVWQTVEASRRHAMREVWSWRWNEDAEAEQGEGKGGAGFEYVPLSHVKAGEGAGEGAGQTESNALQLWSLGVLALERRRDFAGVI